MAQGKTKHSEVHKSSHSCLAPFKFLRESNLDFYHRTEILNCATFSKSLHQDC
jgi:hypothetical protein